MSNLTTIAICSVSEFRKEGSETDKNGNQNVFLSPLSGRIPNKCMVLAGTVALNNDIQVGETYAFKFTEQNPKEDGSDAETYKKYGRQFNTQKIGKATMIDLIEIANSNKQPEVINVSQNVEAKVPELEANEVNFSSKE